MVFNSRVGKISIAFFLFVFFSAFFVFFQSPGVTGGDSGDLVSAAVLGGIPHPPGYPLSTFLGWLLTKLSLGPTQAWRLGLLSSFPAAFSVFLFFLIAKRISKDWLISLVACFLRGHSVDFFA